jgi:feruloyl-CoA synthase
VIACVDNGMRALKADGGGSSTHARRALFLEEPPNIDAGEITDKGYINQRAVLARRAAQVAVLYTAAKAENVLEI